MLNSARGDGETQDQFHLSSALGKEQEFLGGHGTHRHSRQWEDSMSNYVVFRLRVVLGDRSVNHGMGGIGAIPSICSLSSLCSIFTRFMLLDLNSLRLHPQS